MVQSFGFWVNSFAKGDVGMRFIKGAACDIETDWLDLKVSILATGTPAVRTI